jgi:ATP-binding cassette subfamily F protein 3
MIKVVDLKKEFNSQTLFKDVNFHISSMERIAIIGRNGMGKSTLLKILNSEELPTSGSISIVNERIEYLTQEFNFPTGCLVGEYFEDITREDNDNWRMEKIVGQLGLEVDPYREILTLSGGEKMRLKLASLIYNNPTTLLLDEPTNHLDIIGIQWLKSFIRGFKGNIILISHDRDLLNDTVKTIFELDHGTLLRFDGNYDDYVEKKKLWISNKEREFNRFTEKKKQLEGLLKKAQAGIIRSRSGNATESYKKRIDREITKKEVIQYKKKEYSNLVIHGDIHDSKLVMRVNNLTKSFNDKTVLKDISFEVRGKEKIWLFGQNGMGKSTLIKCLLGLEKFEGELTLGESINIGYFEQKQKPMEEEDRLVDYYSKYAGLSYFEVYGALEKYMFTKNDLIKPVNLLSPGQQARLKFALFAQNSSKNNYQLLILDEPAQHLDIETKEVVEDSINAFNGAVILISHDLYSIQRLNIDRTFKLENSILTIE